MTNIDKGLLHRAFSVFLFDSQNRMLLQQRASEKITFPDMWTNTCCSHPLGVPSETGSNLPDSVAGVKNAAQRKLDHELGIKKEQVPLDDFRFLTRIHYKAPSDGKWGEHESMCLPPNCDVPRASSGDAPCSFCDVRLTKRCTPSPVDYILFIKATVDLNINENEVQATQYVTPDQLKTMFQDPALKFTPWFKLICNSMLFEWWEHLDSGLEKYADEQDIRRM